MTDSAPIITPLLRHPSPLEELGGEPLADSGFEQETPDPEFSVEQTDQP